MADVLANWQQVQARIDGAARRAGRSSEDIDVVAVTKKVALDRIEPLVAVGIKAVGENRIQDAMPKYQAAPWRDKVEWHFIGHLQTNKIRQCLRFADLIHSVDSLRLLKEIDARAASLGLEQVRVLMQVNVSGEESKFGFAPEEVPWVLEEAAKFRRVLIQGLMTIAPYEGNSEDTRPCFRQLRILGENLSREGFPTFEMKYLSMGMTNDFEVAIEEGANLVRIGTAIFGERQR